MRMSLLTVLAMALIACTPQRPQTERAEGGCERTATHWVSFSSAAAQDTITATSSGPNCGQAVVTWTLRTHGGDPLWTFAKTYREITVGGDVIIVGPAPAVGDERMDSFLAGWANASMGRSGTLPEMAADAHAPLTARVNGLSYTTSLDGAAYAELRQLNLPLLCYAAGAEMTQCLVIDPKTAAPAPIVAYGR